MVIILQFHKTLIDMCYNETRVLVSVPEQLRKCSGAVTKKFRGSYESVPEQSVSNASMENELNK